MDDIRREMKFIEDPEDEEDLGEDFIEVEADGDGFKYFSEFFIWMSPDLFRLTFVGIKMNGTVMEIPPENFPYDTNEDEENENGPPSKKQKLSA